LVDDRPTGADLKRNLGSAARPRPDLRIGRPSLAVTLSYALGGLNIMGLNTRPPESEQNGEHRGGGNRVFAAL